MNKFTCPCCGHKTLDSFRDWDCCATCGWEDDLLGEVDRRSPANNGTFLSQAQANFILFGASDLRRKEYLRTPPEAAELDENWRPLPGAIELVKQARGRGD